MTRLKHWELQGNIRTPRGQTREDIGASLSHNSHEATIHFLNENLSSDVAAFEKNYVRLFATDNTASLETPRCS